MTTPYSKYYDEVEARAKAYSANERAPRIFHNYSDLFDTDVPALVARCRELEATLAELLSELSVGRNLGKSWSEYQVDDGTIADARAVLGAAPKEKK